MNRDKHFVDIVRRLKIDYQSKNKNEKEKEKKKKEEK